MDFLWKYWPLIQKVGEHRADIERITELAKPTIAELKKVWPQVQPLLAQLSLLLAPALAELRKASGQLWPLVWKLTLGLMK